MESFLITVVARHVLRHAVSLTERLQRGPNIFANVLPANDTEIPTPQIYDNRGLNASFWWYEFNSIDNSTGVGVVSIVNIDDPAYNATTIAKNFFGFLSGLITPVDSAEPYPANSNPKNVTLSYATSPVDGFNTDYPIPNTYTLAHTGILNGTLPLPDIERVKDALDQATYSMWKAISPDPEWDWPTFAIIISVIAIGLVIYNFWDETKEALGKCSDRCGTLFSKISCTREQKTPTRENKKNETDDDLESSELEAGRGTGLRAPLLSKRDTSIN